MIRHRLILLSILLMYVLNCFGQYRKLGVTKSEISKVLFSISDEKKVEKIKGLYFPEYKPQDSVLLNGFKVLKKLKPRNEFGIKGKLYYWKKTFKKPQIFYFDSTLIYQRIFAKNVSKYVIYFKSSENLKWYKKDYLVTFEKYQIPKNETLEGWLMDNKDVTDLLSVNKNSIHLLDGSHRTISISELAIVVYPKSGFSNSDYILGDFKICNYKKEFTTNVYHPFILQYNGMAFKENSEPGVQTNNVLFDNIENQLFPSGVLDISFDSTNHSSYQADKESIIRSFRFLFEQYPFYKEYELDKNLILKKFASLIEKDALETTELLDSLAIIVQGFRDPHFKIIGPKNQSSDAKNTDKQPFNKISQGPVRLYNLYDRIYIAAVLDTITIKKIKPGMEVIAVDNNPINQIIDSISTKYSGNMATRKEKAISTLLNRNIDQISAIKAVINNDTITEYISYNKNYKMPANFANNTFYFKLINKSTGYLRIPSWDLGCYLSFLNSIEKCKDISNLIIDLRNNSGGWGQETNRFASILINKPQIYNHYFFPWDTSNFIRQTSMIKPNKRYNLSHLNIAILINGRTACASEVFCDFMRRNNSNTVIIGNEKSEGALSTALNISLPKNYTLISSLSSRIILSSGSVIESSGIEPDIWISLTTINDLAPYHDKILKSAISLFE